MPIPLRTPAEWFAPLLAWLGRAVAARSGGDQLSYSLIGLIIDRLRGINQRFARLAARIRDGRYAFRSVAAPRRGAAKPRPPNQLPGKFGWLLPLVPDAAGYRSQLEYLLRDAGMVALMEAAPMSLGRPLRSLCWMLGLRPPPSLQLPAKPRPPRKTPPPPHRKHPPQPKHRRRAHNRPRGCACRPAERGGRWPASVASRIGAERRSRPHGLFIPHKQQRAGPAVAFVGAFCLCCLPKHVRADTLVVFREVASGIHIRRGLDEDA